MSVREETERTTETVLLTDAADLETAAVCVFMLIFEDFCKKRGHFVWSSLVTRAV